jgi:phage FluMu protein Com
MGSIVEFTCPACNFATGKLSVGWGRAGREAYWGGLGVCPACKEIAVVDLASRPVDQAGRQDSRRCPKCQGLITLLEGMSQDIPCPRCGARALQRGHLGVWN